ncbi:MAG TPA: TIGR03435 family protein [Bryobacteraceae bacterium]|jgi:uncharacterized protein (TIGR03435 family)|nr:TIGR03435 family protein [Bryobacteraceae bacterium]
MYRIAVAALTAIGLVNGPSARAQAPPATKTSAKFEVASLKPSQPGGRGGGIRPAQGGERYDATNVSLKLIITVAYRVKGEQVVGGPDWMNTELYDMRAKAEKPSSVEELHLMLQDLLADRFKLQFHRESKELPIYALTVDKNGPKLQPHEAQSAGDPWIDQAQEQFLHVKLHAKFVPMDYFAWWLGRVLDRPVLDLTKLKGGYDFDLAYTRELPPGIPEGALLNGEAIDTSGPSIFEAMQKQLGLKLERQKGPVEIIVIDHAEKPTEN